jgi:hypothetical protein
VGHTLATIGGVTANLLTASHTKHSPTGGETVAHSSDKLRQTLIPPKSEEAKAAIAACKSFVSKVESLVGETSEVKTAKSQISLIGKNEGTGMTAFDLGAALLSVPGPLIALLARRHSEVKHGRVHPLLTGPKA